MVADEPARIAEKLVWWRVTIAAPTTAHLPLDEEHVDEGPLVAARADREADVASAVAAAIHYAAPALQGEGYDRAIAVLHALVEGVGVGTCLGRLSPDDAVAILRTQLVCLAR